MRAGLGCPPDPFCINDCENTNFRLKHWLGFREKKLPKFSEKLWPKWQKLIRRREKKHFAICQANIMFGVTLRNSWKVVTILR